MDNKELVSYLKTVLQLEKNKYTLKMSLEQTGDTMERITNSIERSMKRKNRKEPEINAPSSDESVYKGVGYGSLIVGLIFTAISISMDGDFFKFLILSVGIAGFLFAAIFIPIALSYKKKRLAYHSEKIEEYETSLKAEEKRLDRESEYGKHLIAVSEKPEKQLDATEAALKKLYSINVIYPKYQNLVAIAAFCEYFEAGICTQLEGHEGAYTKFDLEVRLDKIITNLERILDSLDQIKNNQYTLYCALRESQYRLERISGKLDRVMSLSEQTAQNSAITAYNTKCSADNTAALNSYMFWRDVLR